MSTGKGIVRVIRIAQGTKSAGRGMGFAGKRGGRGGKGGDGEGRGRGNNGPNSRGNSGGRGRGGGGDSDEFKEAVVDSQIPEAAYLGFHAALDSCGNDGQVAIIEDLGESGFEEGAHYTAMTGSDCFEVIASLCSHPEAVGGPLMEGAGQIFEYLEEVRQRPLDFM